MRIPMGGDHRTANSGYSIERGVRWSPCCLIGTLRNRRDSGVSDARQFEGAGMAPASRPQSIRPGDAGFQPRNKVNSPFGLASPRSHLGPRLRSRAQACVAGMGGSEHVREWPWAAGFASHPAPIPAPSTHPAASSCRGSDVLP